VGGGGEDHTTVESGLKKDRSTTNTKKHGLKDAHIKNSQRHPNEYKKTE
jgi:hypothetical protein